MNACGKRLRPKHWIVIVIVTVVLAEYLGLFRHIKEKDYEAEFDYPIRGDVSKYAAQLKSGETPAVSPVFTHDYYLLKHPKEKCLTDDQSHYAPLRVVYLVKSAADHFSRREAIRKTWGYENRFSDVPVRTVFLLGHRPHDLQLQAGIEAESNQHKDIIQGNFIDTYYNNSIKTSLGLRWAVEHCPKSRFYMFVDDDYYVSTRNLLRFLRNPIHYPRYLEEDVITFDEESNNADNQRMFPNSQHNSNFRSGRDILVDRERPLVGRHLNQLVDFDLPQDVKLFAGYVFPNSRPHRHKFSKWFVDLDEYPFNSWPPYVTAGAYVLSRDALVDMYYTSYFTQLFRFDDIWLGLIAKKADIEPFHCPEFYFYRKQYNVRGYKYVVASHGFGDPGELQRVWKQQKEAGNA